MMLNTQAIKQILIDQRLSFLASSIGYQRKKLTEIKEYIKFQNFAIVISGIRRCGKSTLLRQIASNYFCDEDFFYINFEDERLIDFEAKSFNQLLELLLELYGKRKVFLIDEIQNIPKWELFVRRLLDAGYQFFITGSNAELLSKELGTRLTGRSIEISLMPFCLEEYLGIKNIQLEKNISSEQRALIKREINNFFEEGGLPANIGVNSKILVQNIYRNIISRDVVNRHKVESEKTLKDLAIFLINNISNPISFNKLKQYLNLGHINTVKNYISHLESAWIFHTINIFSTSIKRQQIASKKIYANDLGLINALSLDYVEKSGSVFENFVFLELFKLESEINFYKTNRDKEVDFFLPSKKLLVQACYKLDSESTREREVSALEEAMAETGIKSSYIFTYEDEEIIQCKSGKIHVISCFDIKALDE